MRIYVDVDNTICKTKGKGYGNAIPIQANIDKINKLFDEGNEVYYWTARGTSSGINQRALTKQQLLDWGCKHTFLLMNKPSYDIFIDDKAKRIEEI